MKTKIKTFACSGRTIKLINFNKLYGNEIAELLCDNPTLILELTESDLVKMTGFDIVTVLTVHIWLLNYFKLRIKYDNIMTEEDFEFLFKFNPELIDTFKG